MAYFDHNYVINFLFSLYSKNKRLLMYQCTIVVSHYNYDFIKGKVSLTSLMMFIKVKLYLTSLKMFIKGAFDNLIDSAASLNLTGWHTDEINKNISSLQKCLLREHHRIGNPIKLLVM